MDSPSLKEVDIVELVEFDRELEGGLQVAHGVCEELARARVARRAMPRPLPARATHGGLTASAAHCTHCTALHDHTRLRPGPGTALRLALALCRAGPSGARHQRSRCHRRTAHSAGTRNSFFNSGQRACAAPAPNVTTRAGTMAPLRLRANVGIFICSRAFFYHAGKNTVC